MTNRCFISTYTKGILTILLFLHIASFAQTKDSIIAVSSKDTPTVNWLNSRARAFLEVDSSAALPYAKTAYNLARQLKFIDGQAQAAMYIANYYSDRNEFALSLSNYLEVIELSAGNNNILQGRAFIGLAQIYKDMSSDNTKDYLDRGIDYSRKAYKIYKHASDSGGMANSLNQAAIIFRDKAKEGNLYYYDSAFKNLNEAINLVKINKQGSGILSKLYNNISQVYMEFYKDNNKALEYLLKAVDENKKSGSVWGMTHNYANIAKIYIDQKNTDQALAYARKMLDAAIAVQRPLRIYSAYNILYQVFDAKHIYDSALVYFVKATRLNDSLTSISRTKQVLDLQYKYETAKKELQIKNLSDENSEKSNRILSLLISLVAVAAVAIGIIFLYRRVQKQKTILNRQSKQLEKAMAELQVQKNELEELGKVKDKLFSVISHDLKTPVNTLVSFFDLLDNQQIKPEKLPIYLTTIKKTLLKTSALMSNLLQWAASQMHGFIPHIVDASLAPVADKIIQEVHEQATLKQIKIINDIAPSERVLTDADMLAVVLRNLVANAIKYVQPTVGKVFISAYNRGDMVQITVSDNGIGMSEEEIDQFNNAVITNATKSKSGTANETGTGLGLMLSQSLVKLLNGKITVSSIGQKGTIFTIHLPVEH